ncbi:hypothetical protein DFH28DRAFT_926080 [Melampsora americana]|nr:hypothetical protein DFH28DRAFT_926080 [Melampsora americana]
MCGSFKKLFSYYSIGQKYFEDHQGSCYFYCVESLEQIFETIKDTLEVLYTFSVLDQIGDVAFFNFPNLEVIRTHYLPEELESEIDWLPLPVMKNVRTVATSFYSSEQPWETNPSTLAANLNSLKEVPNLKHIVLSKDEDVSRAGVEVMLVTDDAYQTLPLGLAATPESEL